VLDVHEAAPVHRTTPRDDETGPALEPRVEGISPAPPVAASATAEATAGSAHAAEAVAAPVATAPELIAEASGALDVVEVAEAPIDAEAAAAAEVAAAEPSGAPPADFGGAPASPSPEFATADLPRPRETRDVPSAPELTAALEVPDVVEFTETADAPAIAEVTETVEAAAAADSQKVMAEAGTERPARSSTTATAVVTERRPTDASTSQEAVLDNVVPLTRVIRVEVPQRGPQTPGSLVQRLLTLATTRSASALYLTSQAKPFLRVEGEMRALDSEPVLAAGEIDAVVLELMPESARQAYGRGEPTDWVSDFDGIGRTRCATFKDHRGPGILFHLISTRPKSADQLALAREIQALAAESEGLVVVAGPRASGKSTLVAALVDSINRQLSGSVITIERQIRIVHDNRLSLVSQREVGDDDAAAIGVVRAALGENPDVLVLEDVDAPEILRLALEAAGNGLLVFLTMTAPSTVGALARLVEAFPPEDRKRAQASLADRLRGAISQVVLRKARGGRIAARELLLTSTAVARLIADGQFAQLTVAMESGRKHGMASLNDVLLALVKNGTVDANEAYRKSDNRPGLMTLLGRDGVDTSPLERLA
jgi:twitching motility protein PilT